MTLPYVTSPALNPEAVAAAASHILREYGHAGYTMALEAGGFGAVVFRARASDGGEFRVWADRYGNARTLPEIDDLAEAMRVDREAFDAERAERFARIDAEIEARRMAR